MASPSWFRTNSIADNGTGANRVGTWTTHDFQANYATPWDGVIALGVQNIGEKLPTLVSSGGRDYNYGLYDGYGRYTYFRYTQSF